MSQERDLFHKKQRSNKDLCHKKERSFSTRNKDVTKIYVTRNRDLFCKKQRSLSNEAAFCAMILFLQPNKVRSCVMIFAMVKMKIDFVMWYFCLWPNEDRIQAMLLSMFLYPFEVCCILHYNYAIICQPSIIVHILLDVLLHISMCGLLCVCVCVCVCVCFCVYMVCAYVDDYVCVVVYVCVCVCMLFLCVYGCVHMWMIMFVWLCVYVCVCVCVYTGVDEHMHVSLCITAFVWQCIYYAYVCANVCVLACVQICMCVPTCVCVRTRTYVCVCVCICVRVHTHACVSSPFLCQRVYHKLHIQICVISSMRTSKSFVQTFHLFSCTVVRFAVTLFFCVSIVWL